MNKPKSKKVANRVLLKEIIQRNSKITAIMFLLGFLIGICLLFIDLPRMPGISKAKSEPIADPVDLLWQMRQGEYDKFVLIDTRSKRDFLKAHIKSAVSFPLYDQNGKAKEIDYTLTTQFKNQFNKENRTIIIYGNSSKSERVNTFAVQLKNRGLRVSVLSIGWNEWRHFRNLWLPESQWDQVNMDEYISE